MPSSQIESSRFFEAGLESARRPSSLRNGIARSGEEGLGRGDRAFEALQRPDAALVLVGAGSYVDELRRRPLPEGAILAGFSANTLEYVQHFDVGLLPTLFPHESLPTVVIEYVYCGKPVIASDVGEIEQMIRSEWGALVGTQLQFRKERSRSLS